MDAGKGSVLWMKDGDGGGSGTPGSKNKTSRFLRGRRGVCGGMNWEILIGHTSQIINFVYQTLAFCLRNESVAK